jgi:hypothetical protein
LQKNDTDTRNLLREKRMALMAKEVKIERADLRIKIDQKIK